MITAYPTQTVGNRLIRELVQQETEKRMAGVCAEQAAALAAKDAEIAALRVKLRMAEARSARNYRRLSAAMEKAYPVRRPGAARRIAEAMLGAVTLAWTFVWSFRHG